MSSDSADLVPLIAKRFIQRRDVFAVQTSNGAYMPVLEHKDGPRVPIKGRHLVEHLSGARTYGHYLLDQTDHCKLFAFDIDLEKNNPATDTDPGFIGTWVQRPDLETWTGTDDAYWNAQVVHPCNPREDWKNRAFPGRAWLKLQMRFLSAMLARGIHDELGIPVAVAYTGAKGVHVYGFTGSQPAAMVRAGAQIVLDSLGCFKPHRGQHFFKHVNEDPILGYSNFTIEVFPKQDSLDGKDLGNLMRLPLGKNLKNPADPTFFVDLRAPMDSLVPYPDPTALLEHGDPWRD